MTFSYDETDDFDEADDFDETDDFDDESQDSLLDEEGEDSVDLENPSTALSQAFREATVEVIEEDEEDEDDDEKEEGAEEEEEGAEEEEEGAEEEGEGNDTEPFEQRLAEAIDALPDEEDLEAVDLSPLELPSLEVEPFRPQEQSNHAYADAVTAYYEEKDYQRAVEKFGEAIENEAQPAEGTETGSNEIVAKSMYWQAEAYVKMQDIPQAIGTFESLVQTCQGHYLVLAAQRRADELNGEDS